MSFGSMYVGATGVIAHSQGMQVLANNLANVNTIGYRRSELLFGDLISQQMGSGGAQYDSGVFRTSQIGKGVGVSTIRPSFNEGSLENTNAVTDLALSGEGFFGVSDPSMGATGATHYTRAGSFRFNNDAYLVDAAGFRLQGYAYDQETGQWDTAVSDIRLPYEDVIVDGETARVVRSEPVATNSVEVVANLDHSATEVFSSTDNPFFSMLEAYNGSQSNAATPFGDTEPQYSTAMDVFDAEGNSYEMTVYYDPVNPDTLSNAVPGYSYWEYVIAMPGDADGSAAYGTSGAGLAGMGVLTFNSRGALVNQSAFSLDPSASGDPKDLASWVPATFDEEGLPQFNFTFGADGQSTGEVSTIGYDFGVNSQSSSWRSHGTGSAATLGTDADLLPEMADMDRDARVTTSFAQPSFTGYYNQDGYTWGYLNYLSVDEEGILSGHFSNGQTEELYQVGVYKFNSPWGLSRDGHTNFVATEASGGAIEGVAGDRGRGTINQNSLESSNVDMADEFSNMIVTQRGYQANTKVITTADTMLNTLISVKR
ncbi:MAG: flagellar hook protein FlgE [Pseudodesulfovibrio sp.]|uniref:flagellar hook protein FlgE n=1 Tax=Pseudodesulfovibrio sp. TaxID=2035812 RepID=UPI003D0EF89D